jgi:DNA-binding transcriptional regulator YiaG
MKIMNAKEVKQIRKSLGFTGEQLAKRLGVTANTVFRWEMGIRRVRGAALTMLRELTEEAKAIA